MYLLDEKLMLNLTLDFYLNTCSVLYIIYSISLIFVRSVSAVFCNYIILVAQGPGYVVKIV